MHRVDMYCFLNDSTVECPFCGQVNEVYIDGQYYKLNLKSACLHAGTIVNMAHMGYPRVAVWFHELRPQPSSEVSA